jgi:hypothetical protein
VPRELWVNGVVNGLLLARVMVHECPDEEEQRKVEMIVCADAKENGMAMMNPHNMRGKMTASPTCNFVVGVSVLRRGGLQPELKINPRRLADGNFKITKKKWGNSSSAPLIMRDDARLLWSLYKLPPPPSYTKSLLLLGYASSTKGPVYCYV